MTATGASAFRESAVQPSAAGSRFLRLMVWPKAVQKCKGEAILGSQVSALRYQVRVFRFGCGYGKIQILNPYPN